MLLIQSVQPSLDIDCVYMSDGIYQSQKGLLAQYDSLVYVTGQDRDKKLETHAKLMFKRPLLAPLATNHGLVKRLVSDNVNKTISDVILYTLYGIWLGRGVHSYIKWAWTMSLFGCFELIIIVCLYYKLRKFMIRQWFLASCQDLGNVVYMYFYHLKNCQYLHALLVAQASSTVAMYHHSATKNFDQLYLVKPKQVN